MLCTNCTTKDVLKTIVDVPNKQKMAVWPWEVKQGHVFNLQTMLTNQNESDDYEYANIIAIACIVLKNRRFIFKKDI